MELCEWEMYCQALEIRVKMLYRNSRYISSPKNKCLSMGSSFSMDMVTHHGQGLYSITLIWENMHMQ